MLIHADNLDAMREMESGTFSAVVTDPPYALEFMGKGWDKVLPAVETWRECLRLLKPGGHLLAFGGTRTYHRLTCAIEDAGFEIRDCLNWLYGTGFPKSLDVSKAIDKAAGNEREVVGPRINAFGMVMRWGRRDKYAQDAWTKSQAGKPRMETAPASPAAETWKSYGTALKPAWEPIVLARKPLNGTVAGNCLEHGAGALNVDGCRIPSVGRPKQTAGRWPANVILDPSAAEMLDEQAPEAGATHPVGQRMSAKTKHVLGAFEDSEPSDFPRHDERAGASRFFYCSKADRQDRGPWNAHPTVKPVDLMRWLVRLVKSPSGSRILDPFLGSGTTGVACEAEGVEFVGIERDPDYFAIAQARLSEPLPPDHPAIVARKLQPTLFDRRNGSS